MTREELAKSIYSVSHLDGHFRLRSGATATEYFDKYRFEARPDLLREVCTALVPMVPPDTEMLAALELGGIPIGTMLSQLTDLPTVFVRKKPKEYGTCRLAEGEDIAGKQLLIVEDVVTSGGQIVHSANQLRNLGSSVSRAICVIDRESGGKDNLQQHGIQLDSLFTYSELVRCPRRSS